MADIRKKHDHAWLVRWREGGKQRYKQFRTEADALDFKKAKEGEAEVRRMLGTPVPVPWMGGGGPSEALDAEWSVIEYARRVIRTDDVTPSTRHVYERALRLYVEPYDLGQADVRYVTPRQIDDWFGKLTNGKQDAYRLISKILRRAIRSGDREDDPLQRAQARKPRKRRELDFDPLSAEQIEKLADAATQATKGYQGRVGEMVRQRDRLLILVMGFAGLRAGEAGGLRAQDLVDGCQLRVRQQIVRDGRDLRVAPLKTSTSRRTITIACSLWDELKAFVEEFGTAPDGRLFRGPNGEMRDHLLIRHTVYAAARRAGMTGVHPHLLRHSAVSLLIHGGANPRQVQRFVGHASVQVTLDVYTHEFDEAGAAMGEIMERLREKHRNEK